MMRVRGQGFTLVELIVFIVVVGVALVGIMPLMLIGIERSPKSLYPVRANELAHLYLEEIMSRRFDEEPDPQFVFLCSTAASQTAAGAALTSCPGPNELGPDSGEDRASYDDVDDYHGLKEGRKTSCDPADPPEAEGGTIPDADDGKLFDARGVQRDGYEGFCVEIRVSYDGDYDGVRNETNTAGGNDLADNENQAKVVEVKVTHPFAPTTEIATYRAGF